MRNGESRTCVNWQSSYWADLRDDGGVVAKEIRFWCEDTIPHVCSVLKMLKVISNDKMLSAYQFRLAFLYTRSSDETNMLSVWKGQQANLDTTVTCKLATNAFLVVCWSNWALFSKRSLSLQRPKKRQYKWNTIRLWCKELYWRLAVW